MLVMFCHGLESGPHGRKYHALREAGLEVVSPDCRNKDLGQRIELLAQEIAQHRPAVVVGSSFGGIAGLLACISVAQSGFVPNGLLLCAPALQLSPPASWTLPIAPPAPTTIVHGTADEIVSIEVSRQFASEHDVTLVEVDDDHSLSKSLPTIVELTRACSG